MSIRIDSDDYWLRPISVEVLEEPVASDHLPVLAVFGLVPTEQ